MVQVLERAQADVITDEFVVAACGLLAEGPADSNLVDLVTYEPMTYPVMLHTGIVLDYYTALRLDRCPLTRQPLSHPLKVFVPPHVRTQLYEWRLQRVVVGVQLLSSLAKSAVGKRFEAVMMAIGSIEEMCFGNRNVVSVRFYPHSVKNQLRALKLWVLEGFDSRGKVASLKNADLFGATYRRLAEDHMFLSGRQRRGA